MRMHVVVMLFVLTSLPSFSQVPPADSLLKSRMSTPLLRSEGTMTGEGVCWHAAYGMNQFMKGYRETGDTAYLDAAVDYFDALIDKLHTSPDGYRGWVGPYIYDEQYICDVHIGDAVLVNPMLDFSETVLKADDPSIREAYTEKAQHYLALAKTHLIEKWDHRGTWHEDGVYGAYVSWDHYMTNDNLDEWRVMDVRNSNLSLPFNKQNSMGIACLRIYRITEDPFYRHKALRIFNYMKSRMALVDDHYVWNYWEPFGPWDLDLSEANPLRHWVNVHPYRNYQAGEVHEIAEAYHSGITFTRLDIQRIINTNLRVMWNGDRENPEWRNSNYAVQMDVYGELPIKEAPGGHFPSLAGTLWTGLADFSETVRELGGIEDDSPVSFDRQYDHLPVTPLDRPFTSNRLFIMTAAIPANPDEGEAVLLVTQTRADGVLRIDLVSSDGESVVAAIHDAEDERSKGVHVIQWTPETVPAGDYRIRWTLNDDYREFPVSLP